MDEPGSLADRLRLAVSNLETAFLLDDLPARDRFEREIDAAVVEVESLAGRVEALQDALAWYAERRNYYTPKGASYEEFGANDAYDGGGPGARARAALAVGSVSTPETKT